jgi:pimeloyl-ACP methyl ester carboxylesterase
LTPVVFGTGDRPLLGQHHPPEGEPREAGVLLCYPAPQEYQLTHWALRTLAGLLAREGFHVFRFDYTGTGDSWGGLREASVSRWCEDVRAAATELRDMAGVTQLSCVGFRLGAALATLAAPGLDLDALVLWDPVVRGTRWLADCRALETRLYAELLLSPSPHELLGYELPPEIEAQLGAVDLLAAPPPPVSTLHVVVPQGRLDVSALVARWRDAAALGGPPVAYHHVPEQAGGGTQGALLSNRILTVIARSLAEARA